MEGFPLTITILLKSISLLVLAGTATSASARPSAPVKAAYFYYGGGLSPSDVDASLFTHVIYAFVDLDPITFHVSPASGQSEAIATFSQTLKTTNPFLKTLYSVGGGGSNSATFAAMAATPTTRATFINSTMSLARQYGFDGIDLDWEFPENAQQMSDMATLFAEWRQAAIKYNRRRQSSLLLTAAVYYNVSVGFDGLGARTFPTAAISQYLDFVTIMAYDLHGSWEPTITGEHTALYDSTEKQILTSSYGVHNWISAGLAPSKACLGLAAYGHLWFLKNSSDHGVGAAAISADGTSTFSEIMEAVDKYGGVCDDDETTVSAYCYWIGDDGKTRWAGFDDDNTIAAKVGFVKRNRLRGYSFWSIAGDTQNLLFSAALRKELSTI